MPRLLLVTTLVVTMFSPLQAAAQLPTYGAPRATPVKQERSTAANNEWFQAGAQLGYRIDGNANFEEDLIASGRVVLQQYSYPGMSPNIGFPVIGNVSKLTPGLTKDSVSSLVQRMMNTAEGLNIGLYPYWEFRPRGNGWARATMFGSAVYKANAGRDRVDSSAVTVNQGRISVGVGTDLFVAGKMPLTLSAELSGTFFDGRAFRRITATDREFNRFLTLELTGIAPLGESFGFLGQFAAPTEGKRMFRVGLIYTVSKGKAEGGGGGQGGQGGQDAGPVPNTHGVQILGTLEGAGDKDLEVAAWSGVGPAGNGCAAGGTELKVESGKLRTQADGSYRFSIPASDGSLVCAVITATGGDGQTRRAVATGKAGAIQTGGNNPGFPVITVLPSQ
jgi:hypothetical protein